MDEPILDTRRSRRGLKLIDIDAWLDSSVYGSLRSLGEAYDAFSAYMARFSVGGFRRVFVELAADAATFSILGGMIVLAFAQPNRGAS